MRVQAARRAFTLVEVLVATVILGIVLAALLALVSGTTSFTARSTSASDAVRDISDASGYLGDAFRAAVDVRPAASYSLDEGTASVVCDAGTCIAFDLPTFDANGDRIADDLLTVYAVVERSTLPAAWRSDPPYATDGTPRAVVRYVASTAGSDVLDADYSLLLDNVVATMPTDPPMPIVPFTSAGDGSLRIDLMTARRDRLGLRYFPSPSDGPLRTTVFRRN